MHYNNTISHLYKSYLFKKTFMSKSSYTNAQVRSEITRTANTELPTVPLHRQDGKEETHRTLSVCIFSCQIEGTQMVAVFSPMPYTHNIA